MQVVRGLLFSMGTREHADSQLQATLALTVRSLAMQTFVHISPLNSVEFSTVFVARMQTLCRAFPLVAQCVHAAVGVDFFELFVVRTFTRSPVWSTLEFLRILNSHRSLSHTRHWLLEQVFTHTVLCAESAGNAVHDD